MARFDARFVKSQPAGYALVGSLGVPTGGGTGASLTPGWGSGENRAAGNLLIAWVEGDGTTTLPVTPPGWSVAAQAQNLLTNNQSMTIFYKVATGGDAAPTLAAATSTTWNAQLGEFTGNEQVVPFDQSGTATGDGTLSTLVATTSGPDARPGELVVFGSYFNYTASSTRTITETINNSTTAVGNNNSGAVGVFQSYYLGYAVTNSNPVADQGTWTVSSTTNLLAGITAIASFRLPRGNNLQSVSGGISFTGTKGPTTATKALSGSVSFAGAWNSTRVFLRGLAAALSFTGAQTNNTTKLLPGGVTFAGALGKSPARLLTAASAFSGAVNRGVTHGLSGGLSAGGNVVRAISHLLPGQLSFAGTFSASHLKTLLLSGALSFSGQVTRSTTKAMSGGLSFAGQVRRATAHGLTGGLAFTGTTGKTIAHGLAGALSFAGASVRRTSKVISGGLSFTGSAQRSVGRLLAGGTTFAGNVTRRTNKALAGALSFAGAIVHSGPHFLTLIGGLGFSGNTSKTVKHLLSAQLGSGGSITRAVRHQLTAALSLIGNLAVSRVHMLSLSGALSLSGTVARGAGKTLLAGLTSIGTLSRYLTKQVAGGLSLTGRLVPFFTRASLLGRARVWDEQVTEIAVEDEIGH